jgi:GNAT superfamily N-acetyltransferase
MSEESARSPIRVTVEDPRGAAAARLLPCLIAELAARYPEEETDAALPAQVDGSGGAFVIAWLDDVPAGCGALRPMAPSVAEVKRMFVDPAHRGRGIGRAILAKLELVARGYGYSRLRLETGVRQPEAIHLYVSCGFRRIDCYGQYAGSALSVCYEKTIQEPICITQLRS